MTTLTLTSKRQATFPKETCESLGLKPGDVIELDSREEGGTRIWVLRPPSTRTRAWVGCLGSRAKNVADHSIKAIRTSIAAGRRGLA
jgi:bifunctional DNA-binding transcriptional regulator/antitoxin component of YhaV-PrlF toxin-antitoxin module